VTGHVYLSTACWHAAIAEDREVIDAFHARCRRSCKFCHAPCYCDCHSRERREATIPRPAPRRVTVATEGQPE
jgi:hypothetical protein